MTHVIAVVLLPLGTGGNSPVASRETVARCLPVVLAASSTKAGAGSPLFCLGMQLLVVVFVARGITPLAPAGPEFALSR